MRDRKEMQLPITPFCYEKFLRQLNVNFVRTLRLRPIRKLSYALFVTTCKVHEEMFSGCSTSCSDLTEFSKALHEKNYKKYLKSMI